MLGTLQRAPCATTRTRARTFVASRRSLLISAHAANQHQLSTQGPQAHSSLHLTRRQLLGVSGPLLALVAGGLPGAQLVVGTPQAAAAAAALASSGPELPSPEVKAALNKALSKYVVKAKAPAVLRLVFHDAGTFSAASGDGGVNGSIQYELDRPENRGLKRAWRVIEQTREDLQGTPAEGRVTEADLVALAGAYAVRLCGGPDIPVPVGRPVAAAGSADPPGRMPGETFTAEQLKANFAAKGFNVQEMVALSGAHTIGSKGFGDAITFDNEYYKALLKKPWLNPNDSMASMIGLPSDHVLPDDPDCLPYIRKYADDQGAFFRDFSAAYVKLCSLGVPGWAA